MRILVGAAIVLTAATPASAQRLHRDTQSALIDAIDRICAPVMQGGDAARLLTDATTRGWKPIAGSDPPQLERSTPSGRIVVEWPSIFRVCKVSTFRASLIDDREGYRITSDWAEHQPGMAATGTIETSGSRNVYRWTSPKLRIELQSRFKPDAFPNAPQDHLLIRPAK